MPAASGAGGAVPPQPLAAGSFAVYQKAKTVCTTLMKHHLCGDPEADRDEREAIIDGLKNTLDRVEMLDGVAEAFLGIGGDVTEEFQTSPTLEDVNVNEISEVYLRAFLES